MAPKTKLVSTSVALLCALAAQSAPLEKRDVGVAATCTTTTKQCLAVSNANLNNWCRGLEPAHYDCNPGVAGYCAWKTVTTTVSCTAATSTTTTAAPSTPAVPTTSATPVPTTTTSVQTTTAAATTSTTTAVITTTTGVTTTSVPPATTTTNVVIQPTSVTSIPRRALIGYWHNFENGSGYIKIKDTPPAWDIINLSFAENSRSGVPGEVDFILCPKLECGAAAETEDEFKAGIKSLQAQGKKVIMSLGGANAHIALPDTQARDNFVRTMGDLIAKYGLDGLDLDLEGGSFNLNPGDTDFTKPTTPAVVNMISAVKTLKQRFGPNFILTMAPEVAYVQGAATYYGGIWGAYLPVIHGLRNDLNILQVQLYNTGGNVGSDGVTYNSGTQDFLAAMSDMMITGFRLGGGATGTTFFLGLRADQVALGLPSGAKSASSGYTTVTNVQKAVDCLVKGTNCAAYKPTAKHTEFRGLMTWSINWDKADGFNFSRPHRTYLNQLA